MKLRWTEPALCDLESIGDHIVKTDPAAAARVIDRISTRVDQLVEFPHLGRPGRVEGIRELIITTTPFLVPYRVRGEIIELFWPSSTAPSNGLRRSIERSESRQMSGASSAQEALKTRKTPRRPSGPSPARPASQIAHRIETR